MMPTTTVYWRYKVSWLGVIGYADNGVLLDKLVADALKRVDKMSDVTIEVVFGGSTAS